MGLVNHFSRLCFALVLWFLSNALIFLSVNLSWVRYPILFNIEVLLVLFIIACVYDLGKQKPWTQFRRKTRSFGQAFIQKDFKDYVKTFGFLALIWSIEIILQKYVFSTIFGTTVHYIDGKYDPLLIEDQDDSGKVPLVCMDGTVLFSLRQMVIFVAAIATILIDYDDVIEKSYFVKSLVVSVPLVIGAAFSVYDTHSQKTSTGKVFLALLWILLRVTRMVLTKWVQKRELQHMSITRFLRLLIPCMLLLLLPCFFASEMRQMKDQPNIIPGKINTSDENWLDVVTLHFGQLAVYSVLFFTSLLILLDGGTAADYNMWLVLREVIWNTACSYTIGVGELVEHVLGPHQIAGLVIFFSAWTTYLVMYWIRFVQKYRLNSTQQIKNVEYSAVKEVTKKESNNPLEPIILDSLRFSD